MQQTALVTGGFGFLGRAVGRRLKDLGFKVEGVGHGEWTLQQAQAHGFDTWRQCDVSVADLKGLDGPYALVVHCAGAGSVARSMSHPLEAFRKTVQGTAELLEHLRVVGSKCRLVYPSSAAIYGAAQDRPMEETDPLNPVSPYGYHVKMTEDLLAYHARFFGTKISVIRFFSIYGPGLAKQLLWDAASKLSSGEREVTFWGTGEETRDWIHVDDAASLMTAAAFGSKDPFLVVNGASGERVTVSSVLSRLRDSLGVDVPLRFNGVVKPGDPRYYHADITRASALGWRPSVQLSDGIDEYVHWVRRDGMVRQSQAANPAGLTGVGEST